MLCNFFSVQVHLTQLFISREAPECGNKEVVNTLILPIEGRKCLRHFERHLESFAVVQNFCLFISRFLAGLLKTLRGRLVGKHFWHVTVQLLKQSDVLWELWARNLTALFNLQYATSLPCLQSVYAAVDTITNSTDVPVTCVPASIAVSNYGLFNRCAELLYTFV